MNDLIQRIVAAIIRQEAMPVSYTNPGNLRDCPWFPKMTVKVHLAQTGPPPRVYPDGTPVVFSIKGFWNPRSRNEGVAGIAHIVALHIAEGNSLDALISSYAPTSDHNRTDIYIENVKQWAKIPDEHAPLWSFLL